MMRLLLCCLPLFAFGQYLPLCNNDSLSPTEQEIARKYPFIEVQCNQFQFFGYFLNEELVGFHTLLLNYETLETYFLGYNEQIQKENMLYLNMLYNMTEYGIENGFKRIIFGRTALEIKSSIGATPVQMSGFIYHNNKLINRFIGKIFKQLEPELHWQQRHPFK
jgi:hypothetical protein